MQEGSTVTIPRGGQMRAVTQDRYGSPQAMRVAGAAVPSIGPDEVLVEVRAAGVDRGVWHVMRGTPYVIRLTPYGGLRGPKNPVPGSDVAGRVVAVGNAVTRFTEGDEVFGIGAGTFAQYARAKESTLAHKPPSVPFAEAGAATISGITALEALTSIAPIEPGQKVLVIGASGGVGSFAVQIAHARGAVVTGAASSGKADFVRGLGADHVLDYRSPEYLDDRERYDVIVVCGGNDPLRRLRRALTPEGTLVIVGGEGGGKLLGIGRQLLAVALSPFVKQRMTFFLNREATEDIEALAGLMESGSVHTAIGESYALDDVPDALEDLEHGRVAGKAVIVIDE